MVLADIYVPAVDKTYDFNLNEDVSVGVIIDEIVEMIGQKERTTLAGDASALSLCDRSRQKFLPRNASLAACGIQDGSSLLLV